MIKGNVSTGHLGLVGWETKHKLVTTTNQITRHLNSTPQTTPLNLTSVITTSDEFLCIDKDPCKTKELT